MVIRGSLKSINKKRHHFASKVPYSQDYGFSSSHVWMWELDHTEGWMLKNWSFWTVVLEQTLESLLDFRRSNQSILKESPEYSLEGLMLRLKFQYFGHLMWRATSLEKTPTAGKNWRQEKRMTEHEMVGWHHQLDGHEFKQTPGDDEGQGSLACCSPWGHRE